MKGEAQGLPVCCFAKCEVKESEWRIQDRNTTLSGWVTTKWQHHKSVSPVNEKRMKEWKKYPEVERDSIQVVYSFSISSYKESPKTGNKRKRKKETKREREREREGGREGGRKGERRKKEKERKKERKKKERKKEKRKKERKKERERKKEKGVGRERGRKGERKKVCRPRSPLQKQQISSFMYPGSFEEISLKKQIPYRKVDHIAKAMVQ